MNDYVVEDMQSGTSQDIKPYVEEAKRIGQSLYEYYKDRRDEIVNVSFRPDPKANAPQIYVSYQYLVMSKDSRTEDGGDFCIEVTVRIDYTYCKFTMRWKDNEIKVEGDV